MKVKPLVLVKYNISGVYTISHLTLCCVIMHANEMNYQIQCWKNQLHMKVSVGGWVLYSLIINVVTKPKVMHKQRKCLNYVLLLIFSLINRVASQISFFLALLKVKVMNGCQGDWSSGNGSDSRVCVCVHLYMWKRL